MAVPHLYRSKCTLPLGKIDNTPILPSLRVYALLVGGQKGGLSIKPDGLRSKDLQIELHLQ